MIEMIAAVANNRIIGNAGSMPWHIPEDLKFFKEMTIGKKVVMGRKTFESIGRVLPDRNTIVMTRADISGVTTASSMAEVMRMTQGDCIIAGGGKVYRQFMPFLADKLYVTAIMKDVEGDTLFPTINPKVWQLLEMQELTKSAIVHTYIRT